MAAIINAYTYVPAHFCPCPIQDHEAKAPAPALLSTPTPKASAQHHALSDREVMEKLIVVTPSRKVRAAGGQAAAMDRDTSKLINEGLAHLEQEFQEVRAVHGSRVLNSTCTLLISALALHGSKELKRVALKCKGVYACNFYASCTVVDGPAHLRKVHDTMLQRSEQCGEHCCRNSAASICMLAPGARGAATIRQCMSQNGGA